MSCVCCPPPPTLQGPTLRCLHVLCTLPHLHTPCLCMCLHCTATHVLASHPALGQHPLRCWRMDGLGDVLGGGCHALSPLIQPSARHTLWVTAARAHCIQSSRISTLSPRMCMLLTLALGQHRWRMDTLGAAGVGTVPCIAHPLTPQRDTRPGWLHARARLLDVIRCETGFRGRAPPSHTHDAR